MWKPRQYGCCIAILGLWLFAAAFGADAAQAQDVSDVQVKSAFLYNFARFVEWPHDAFAGPGAPITIGVVGNNHFARTLEQTVRGRQVNGRPISVKVLTTDGDLKSCHILYIQSSSDRRTSAILADTDSASVLTVGDSEHFAHIGGVINFFVQDSRVRFEINPDAAERAHLRISAKLLALARVVRGVGTAR
jgi:hypothetical protein